MIWRYEQFKYSYFLESDIKISPITKEANPPGMNLTVNILVKSIIMPIKHSITPNLNFHLLCIHID